MPALIIDDAAKDSLHDSFELEDKLGEHLKPRKRLSWLLSQMAMRYEHLEIHPEIPAGDYSFRFAGWYKEKDGAPNIVGGIIYHGKDILSSYSDHVVNQLELEGWQAHT